VAIVNTTGRRQGKTETLNLSRPFGTAGLQSACAPTGALAQADVRREVPEEADFNQAASGA